MLGRQLSAAPMPIEPVCAGLSAGVESRYPGFAPCVESPKFGQLCNGARDRVC